MYTYILYVYLIFWENILIFARNYSFSEADEFGFLCSCPYIYLVSFSIWNGLSSLHLLWCLFTRQSEISVHGGCFLLGVSWFFLGLILPSSILSFVKDKTVTDNEDVFFLSNWDFAQFQPIFMLQQMVPSRSLGRRHTAFLNYYKHVNLFITHLWNFS